MHRFFVESKYDDKSFLLSDDILRHIRVLRLKDIERIICIYKGIFYVCYVSGDKAMIENIITDNHEFDGEVVIALGVIKTKNFEFAIQKLTELGVKKIIPLISQNTSKQIPHDFKIERFKQIALNAAQQSFRNFVPEIIEPMTFDEVINLDFKNKYIAHEKNDSVVMKSFEPNTLFIVGPEGGFTEIEVNNARQNNCIVISLGKRILRSETASLFLLSRLN